MRYKEIKPLIEQQLDEINMSPTSLRKLAATIPDALAGMEFELVIPGLANDDTESEPDYSEDVPITLNTDISDVIDFFDNSDYNDPGTMRNFRDKITEDFQLWALDQVDIEWGRTDTASEVEEYLKNYSNLEGEELEAAVGAAMTDYNSDYDSARDHWIVEHLEYQSFFEWAKSNGYSHMSDIESNYNIMWPHWTTVYDGYVDPEDVVSDFQNAIGKPVVYSNEYHSVNRNRNGNAYIAEPDSTIKGNDNEGGLEFISPPQSIPEMISDLHKVAEWAKEYGAYTNHSTGLHINISVPNYSIENLDFVKLALLMGDKYVLQQFNRLGNSFAASAIDLVKKKSNTEPELVAKLFDAMRVQLNTAASKIIHSGITGKYTSINTKMGWVEFRSPGGYWLTDFSSGKVEQTLLRFVVALDAAVDESKYRKEYATKLYKLLAPAGTLDNTIQYFAEYAAGELSRSGLIANIRNAQSTRQHSNYNYEIVNPNGIVVSQFRARNDEDAAIQFNRKQLGPKFTLRPIVSIS